MRFRFKVRYTLPFMEDLEGFKYINARTPQLAIEKFKRRYPYYTPVSAS